MAVTMVGDATTLVMEEDGAPFTNVTSVLTLSPAKLAMMATCSAVVEVTVVVKWPVASLAPMRWAKVVLVPVVVKVTACPDTGLPRASVNVSVSVLALVPFAVTVFGLAVSVELPRLGCPAKKVTN